MHGKRRRRQLHFQALLAFVWPGSSSFQGASAFPTFPRRPTALLTRAKGSQPDASASVPAAPRIIGTNSQRHDPITAIYGSKYSAGTTPEGEPSAPEPTKSSSSSSTGTTNHRPPLSTTSLGTILRKLWSPIAYFQRCLFRAITKSTAAFLTAVISEPNCNRAFATVIMRGCNRVLTSNKLKERLVAAQITLSHTEPSLAKLTGEDFWKVFVNFLFGLIDPSFDYAPKKEKDDD